MLSGFIPKVGPIITVAGFFTSARDADLAKKIRTQTDREYDVMWRCIETNYGTFHTAEYWGGRYIDLSLIDSNYATEVLVAVSYR